MSKNIIEDEDEPLTPTPTGAQTTEETSGAKPSLISRIAPTNVKKLVIVLVAVLFVLMGCGYYVFKVLKKPKDYNNAQELAKEMIQNNYIELKEMIINLAPSGNKPNYLKISLILQLSSDNDSKIVESKVPIILDNYYLFLKELRATDFSSTGNTLMLKEELLKRVNKIAAPVVVKDVLFKEIIIN